MPYEAARDVTVAELLKRGLEAYAQKTGANPVPINTIHCPAVSDGDYERPRYECLLYDTVYIAKRNGHVWALSVGSPNEAPAFRHIWSDLIALDLSAMDPIDPQAVRRIILRGEEFANTILIGMQNGTFQYGRLADLGTRLNFAQRIRIAAHYNAEKRMTVYDQAAVPQIVQAIEDCLYLKSR